MPWNIYNVKTKPMNQDEFVKHFAEALELTAHDEVEMRLEFKNLREWDSLASLSLIAMLDEEYEVELESEDLDALSTVEDLYLFVKSKL